MINPSNVTSAQLEFEERFSLPESKTGTVIEEIPELPKDDPALPELYRQAEETLDVVSPEEAITKIRSSFETGSPVCITVTGTNMLPFLDDQRDSVVVAPIRRRIREGDIILFLRNEYTPVLERVIRVPQPKQYLCCGDAQMTTELISRKQVIGIVTDVVRHKEYISCSSFSWRTRSSLWIRLKPLRPKLLRFVMAFRKFANRT